MPGPGAKNGKTLQASSVVQPDNEVARLRKELQLCNLKLSQMQARLMATLDELDASRNAHQLELKAERRAKEKLSEKLDRYLDEVKRADAEKDEMREVVSILVEKVEACNNYSAWPCARMSLTRPLDTYIALQNDSTQVDRDGEMVRTALLATLHKKLEEERHSHTRTKEEADAEILRLRAMVARRDAELEACVTHSGHRVLLSSSLSTDMHHPQQIARAGGRAPCTCEAVPGSSYRSYSAVSQDERDPVVSLTVTRQRILEREVDFLQGQLRHAQTSRMRATTVNADAHTPPPSILRTTTRHSDLEVEAFTAARSSKSADALEQTHRAPVCIPSSPQLRPRTAIASPSPYVLTPANARTPSRAHGSQSPLDPYMTYDVIEQEPTPVRSARFGSDDLKQQIEALSAEIDAFSAERDALKKTLTDAHIQEHVVQSSGAPPPTDGDGVPELTPAPSLHHEASCASAHCMLREQLDKFILERVRREQEMQAEIDALQQALLTLRAQQRDSTDDDETRCAPGDSKVPLALQSPSARPSPPITPASSVLSPLQHLYPSHNVPAVNVIDDGDEFTSEKHTQNTEVADNGAGSEMEEQSMELATPLHPTILSLADDDLLIPPPNPPSLPSSTTTHSYVEPSDIPLPISPDGDWADSPPLAFRPPLVSSPPHRQAPSPTLSKSAHASPQLLTRPPSISSDLLARVESATQARVDEIEREFNEVQRSLDVKTRELEDTNAALAQLCVTTSRLRGEVTDGDAGSSGGVHAHRDPENAL
ncbi:hypothetical protein DICSQDRAFT_181272 [Dichomitus squalens LYAD-421 SS1]|uniref:Uncharacterized protein n=1 Tax=Dichomitus squalens (strain LYAD-421) TaxID=732165 RepID=R7SX84_DICSQ|nr:uncharacterized protein DICSQDRAFT_181272 [Dichomitus squalens LYAD-421 SS1]EJF60568.1 hypothetical protein DICSQDRAFT_181272 [Dichomitus squalens LYAD-421 SS1]